MLLYHIHERGHVACAQVALAGIRAAERHYIIEGHLVEVDGAGEPVIAQYDAEQLLASGAYRLASPQEQNQHAALKKKMGALVEGKRG